MKAAVHTSYGPPEGVRIADVDRPVVRDGELLVRVRATTVNRTDCGYRAAKPFILRFFTGLIRPKVTILGTEFAGDVEAVGHGVTSFEVGDRVFGYSEGRFGAHAEYMTVPADGFVATVPAGLGFEEAAPATEGSHYALSIIRKTKVTTGQSVLVYGATGAIGSAAVQLLKSMGVDVTAVCATDHVELVEGLGADRVVDYTAGDFTQDVRSYDVVLDAVGKSTFGRCRRLLTPHGVYASTDLGPWGQNLVLGLVTPLLGRKRAQMPTPIEDPTMATYFKELMESGEFKPVVDRCYPLDEIVDAYRYVETGQKIGNVVIAVD